MVWAQSKDWKLAVAAGVDVVLEKYHQLAIQNAAKEGAEAKGYSYETARACATYSTYNTGSNPKRFYTESDGRDTGFYNIYVNKPWLQGVSTSAINELSKVNYVSVATVAKAPSNSRVRVYSSASSGALTCGWLDVGDTVYIIGNPGGGAYYSFYTDHGACGYVQAAYIQTTGNVITMPEDNTDEGSAESVPVEDLPDTVCTASEYDDVKTGDTVTFTVEAKEGSSNFKIKINDLDPVACTADLNWGKYKLDYVFKTTGANKILITWTAPDGQVCSAKCKFNVTVSPNKKDWNSNYSNGILNIRKKDGKLGIDNLYGLYVEQDDEYIRGVRAKEYPITSATGENWDVYDDLHLESGKYSYGIVSTACNWAGGHTYAKLGSFTVTEEQAREEKTMYVISPEGADIYGGFSWILKKPNNKFKDLRYEYGDVVTVYVGAERNGYSQVKISGSDTRKAYVASNCLGQTMNSAAKKDSSQSKNASHPYQDFFPIWPVIERGKEKDVGAVFYYVYDNLSYMAHDSDYKNAYGTIRETAIDAVGTPVDCKASGASYSHYGSEIIAVEDGYVIYVVNNSTANGKGTTANEVWLLHTTEGSIYISKYKHLPPASIENKKGVAGVSVSVGDYVKKGATLGLMGNTGNSTGTHLHFMISRLILSQTQREEIMEMCNSTAEIEKVYAFLLKNIPFESINPIEFYLWREDIQEIKIDFPAQQTTKKPLRFGKGMNLESSMYKHFSRTYECFFNEQGELLQTLHGGSCCHNEEITLLEETAIQRGLNFQLSFFDKDDPLDSINQISGFISQGTSFEVSNRTGSVWVNIPIDPDAFELEIHQGGKTYENGDEIPFLLPRLNFDVVITDKTTGEAQCHTFTLTKKAEIDQCDIDLLYVTFCDAQGNAIANDIINDFFTAQTFDVPYSTAKVKISHMADGNYSYVRYATEESLIEDRWIPVDIMADMDADSKVFTLGVYSDAGTEVGKFTYTLVRQPKSSEADLNSLEVSAYDVSNELIGSEVYVAEKSIRVDLPYGTSAIDLVTSVSAFATETYTLNGSELYGLNGITISDGDVIEISVIAEDGTVETYTIYISINQIADTISPAIHVVGSSGKIYESGSMIAEEIEIEVSDDSWYWYEITCGGECVEEIVTSDTAYMITAYDVAGNSSTFMFWYSETEWSQENLSQLIASYDPTTKQVNLRNVSANIKVIIAGYQNGRMVTAYSAQNADGNNLWTISTDIELDSIKFFFLDSSFAPLCTAKAIIL